MEAMRSRLPNLKAKLARLPGAERLRRIVATQRQAEVYLVGGAVRDLLLKRRRGDLDFVVRGVPLTMLQQLLGKHGEVNLVGKTFGVLKFTPRGSKQELDIALPRTEHAFGTGGTRDVEVQSDATLPLERDLERRDFTVNAMAVDLATGALIDPHGGLNDLAGEQLRAVGDPAERFTEDNSRMLRGLRFAIELGFTIEPKTWRTLKTLVLHLAAAVVPRELVSREFLKAFAVDPLKTVDLWDLSGAFRAVMPEVLAMRGCPQHRPFHSEGDVWTHARLALEMAGSAAFKQFFKQPPTLETMVAIFLHDVGKPLTTRTPEQHGTDRIRSDGHDVQGARLAHRVLERLRFSSYEGTVDADRVAWLVEHHMIALAAREMRLSTLEKYFITDRKRGDELLKLMLADGLATISNRGRPTIGAFTVLQRRLATISRRPRPVAPLVRGDELMRTLGLKSGPRVGELLDVLRDAQLEGKIKTKAAALTLARKLAGKRGR